MINATDELLSIINASGKTSLEVKCAVIGMQKRGWYCSDSDLISDHWRFEKIIRLPLNWSNDEWVNFLKNLNFNYAGDEYGDQEMYGYVWFKDGSWLERYEYDGREEWHFKSVPDINKFFS